MKYTEEEYDSMIQRSYGYIANEQGSVAWNKVKFLYQKNYVFCNDTAEHIPRKIHQIWLGGRVPEKYREFMDSWQRFNPSYEYKLWTDKEAKDINMSKRNIFESCKNNGMKSDLLRYEILRQEGGIYVDTDFECLKPFDDLLYLKFFTGISYDAKMVLYIGIIGSTLGHGITTLCADLVNTSYGGNDAMTIMDLTGPYYFTRCFLRATIDDTDGVVAFPMDFFYPLPNNLRGINNPYQFVRPCSYAIHHWEVSWQIK